MRGHSEAHLGRGETHDKTIRNELIDELLAGQDPSSVMRQDGLLGDLKKALLNRLMAAESSII